MDEQASDVAVTALRARLARAYALLFAAGCSACAGASDEIDYRGQKIKLSKSYASWEEYKNDPNNIAPFEIDRVQRLVADAPIGSRFDSLIDASRAVGAIAFPGYGSSGFTDRKQPDGSALTGFSVEIPQAAKERYFVFRGSDGAYTLIDDFIVRETPLVQYVERDGDVLVFRSAEGKEIFTRPARR
jgi:hypothetical protein